MTSLLMDASIVVGLASIVLAAGLLSLYRKLYAETKSRFGLGLLIFAAAFVAQSALTVISDLSAMPLLPASFVPYVFGIGLCEMTGLAAMVWTASR